MALSMQDLKGDDGTTTAPSIAQYHDVGINTSTKGEGHGSGANTHAYSPLMSNGKTTDESNGFSTRNSASSPSTTRSSPPHKVLGSGQASGASLIHAANRSPNLAMPPSYQEQSPQQSQHYSHQHLPHHQHSPSHHQHHGHHQQARMGSARSTSTSFSPYAYPSPLQEYPPSDVPGGFLNGQQRNFVAPHRYPSLDGGYGGANGGNGYGPYRGNPMSPSMSVMPSSAAGWPIDGGSGTGRYYGGGVPQQQQQQQQTASWNSMMPMAPQQHHNQPHHQRISSSASRPHPSSTSTGVGPVRGPTNSNSGAHRQSSPASVANMDGGVKGFNGNNDNNQRDEGQRANSGGGAVNSSSSSMRYRSYDSSSAVW